MSGEAARLSVLIEAAEANSADFLILETAPNADQTALRAAQTADVGFNSVSRRYLRP